MVAEPLKTLGIPRIQDSLGTLLGLFSIEEPFKKLAHLKKRPTNLGIVQMVATIHHTARL